MAGKISEMTAASSVVAGDQIEVLQSGANKSATFTVLTTFVRTLFSAAGAGLGYSTGVFTLTGSSITGLSATNISAGTLDIARIADGSVTKAKIENVAASKILGRGSASGAGAPVEITLGTNLTMTGTTLDAAGGSGAPGGSDTQVQFNDGSAFGGDSALLWNKTTNILTVPFITDASYIAGRFLTLASTDGGNPSINTSVGVLQIGASLPVQVGSGTYFNNSTGDQVLGSTYQRSWSASTPSAAPDTGEKRIAAGVVGPTNGSSGAGWFQNTAGRASVSTQVDATTTSLASITALSRDLAAGSKKKFWYYLPVTADATGGYKVAVGGTCSATAIYYDVTVVANGVAPSLSRQTAMGGAASGTLGTTVGIYIEGFITVNAAGTLVPQFAQSAANGTSSVLVGADAMLEDYP